MNRRTAFTLIELVMSVSIVALLMAILVPAVMHARSLARRTMCQSNLRQWALGAQSYADVHDGRLPYRGQGMQPTTRLNDMKDWINALPPYIESSPYADLVKGGIQPRPGAASVWMCPDAMPLDPLPPKPFDPQTFFAYGMNMALSTPFNRRPDNVEKIGPKQTMVFMADGVGAYCSVIPHREAYSPIARHAGKTVNIAFLDGRVETYLSDDVGCGVGDPERPDVRWRPPGSKWPGPPK
jgi:prepilin-type processing-associated H-X9-DG protein/prepilin-type N-terminal cleavage/methylation domain-containing protein